jgi:hypothetical protein
MHCSIAQLRSCMRRANHHRLCICGRCRDGAAARTVNTLSLRGEDNQEAIKNAAFNSLERRAYAQKTKIERHTIDQQSNASSGPAYSSDHKSWGSDLAQRHRSWKRSASTAYGLFESRNLTSARIYGAEAQVGLTLGDTGSPLANWSMRSSVAWARGEKRETDQPLNSVDPLKGLLGLALNETQQPWCAELIALQWVVRQTLIIGRAATCDARPCEHRRACIHECAARAMHARAFDFLGRTDWEWPDVCGRPANDP